MEVNERIEKLDKRISKIEDALPNIQLGINEIKVLLEERPKQEELKNDMIVKDVTNLESRVKKIEDNLNWLWKTVAGTIITTVVAAIVFVIKMM